MGKGPSNRSERIQLNPESIKVEIAEAFVRLKESKLSKKRHVLFRILERLYEGFTVKASSWLNPKQIFGLSALPGHYGLYEKYVIRLNMYIYRINEEYLYDYYAEVKSDIKFGVQRELEYVAAYKKRCPKCRLIVTYNGKEYLDIVGVTESVYEQDEHVQKSILTNHYYFLTPSSSVLKTRPTSEREATPMFFRKTGPVAADIEGGTVYVHPEVSEIIDALRGKHIVILCGDAASGKTVAARVVAYHWMKTGSVRFVQLKTMTIMPYELSLEMARYGQDEPDPLLVIEDVHLKMNDINEMLAARSEKWPRVLFTARQVKPMLHSQETNNFDLLDKVILDQTCNQVSIIQMYLEKKGWRITAKLIKDIYEISGQNLWLQAYALQSLCDSKRGYVSTELILKKVKQDLEDLSRTKVDLGGEIKLLLPRVLITLSILYRYEIPTDIRFLNHIFPYPNVQIKMALDVLVQMGEALVIERNDHFLYGLPHSALAHLYFQLLSDPCWDREPVYGDEFQFIGEYIESEKTINGSELFYILNRKRDYQNVRRKIDWQRVYRKIDNLSDLFEILRYFWAVSLTDRVKYDILMKNIDKDILAHKICRSNDLFSIGQILELLVEADTDAGMKILKEVDLKRRAAQVSDSENPISVVSFIESLFKIDPRLGKKIWKHIDIEKLSFSLNYRADVKDVRWFMERVLKIYPEGTRALVRHIDAEQFARTMCKERYLADTLTCFESILKADTGKADEVWGYVDLRRLARRLRVFDIEAALLSIARIYELYPKAGKEMVKHVDTEKLALVLYESRKRIRIERYLRIVFAIDVDVGRKVVMAIRRVNTSRKLSHIIDNIENSLVIKQSSGMI
jgi:hypothetical protein